MTLRTAGIHHITAYAQDPQKNVDFYTGVLGLRMVKKTVNYDAPEIYHFYFGMKEDNPVRSSLSSLPLLREEGCVEEDRQDIRPLPFL